MNDMRNVLIFHSGSQKCVEQAEITKECNDEYRPALQSHPAILPLWEPNRLLRVEYFVLRHFNNVVPASDHLLTWSTFRLHILRMSNLVQIHVKD